MIVKFYIIKDFEVFLCTKFRFSSTLFAGDITRKVNPLDPGLLVCIVPNTTSLGRETNNFHIIYSCLLVVALSTMVQLRWLKTLN